MNGLTDRQTRLELLRTLRVLEEPNQSDRNENVFEGLIKITLYEGKGFIVNLPEFYRRLKKLFTK